MQESPNTDRRVIPAKTIISPDHNTPPAEWGRGGNKQGPRGFLQDQGLNWGFAVSSKSHEKYLNNSCRRPKPCFCGALESCSLPSSRSHACGDVQHQAPAAAALGPLRGRPHCCTSTIAVR